MTKDSIYVQFDKAVDDITATDISIYKSADPTQKLTVSIQAAQPDSLVITTSDQAPYENYTVEIDNVKAQAGLLSNAVIGAFSGFQASVVTSDFFKISKVTPVDRIRWMYILHIH